MAKFVDEGENRVSDILFGSQAVDASLYMGIYNDVAEPPETATIASLSELSGNGYARKTLSRGTWTVSGSISTYAQQTFTASGGDWGSCYGYFIATSSDDSGKLLCVEHFSDGPYDVDDTQSIKITPNLRVA